MVKQIVFVGLAVLILAAATLGGAALYRQATVQAQAPASQPSTSRTITVVGQGTTHVQPDIAQVSVGVDTTGTTVSEAVKENNDKMDAILAALKEMGIATKDIQTSNYSIYVDQTPQPVPSATGTGTEQTPKYRVSNMVTVTIRDLTKVGSVIDATVSAGANSVWGVSFSVDDPKAAQADARSEAIADAQSRAEALAQLTGVKLGQVMAVSEVTGGITAPTAISVERAVAGGGTSISPGEVEVSYQVQVVFYIQP